MVPNWNNLRNRGFGRDAAKSAGLVAGCARPSASLATWTRRWPSPRFSPGQTAASAFRVAGQLNTSRIVKFVVKVPRYRCRASTGVLACSGPGAAGRGLAEKRQTFADSTCPLTALALKAPRPARHAPVWCRCDIEAHVTEPSREIAALCGGDGRLSARCDGSARKAGLP